MITNTPEDLVDSPSLTRRRAPTGPRVSDNNGNNNNAFNRNVVEGVLLSQEEADSSTPPNLRTSLSVSQQSSDCASITDEKQPLRVIAAAFQSRNDCLFKHLEPTYNEFLGSYKILYKELLTRETSVAKMDRDLQHGHTIKALRWTASIQLPKDLESDTRLINTFMSQQTTVLAHMVLEARKKGVENKRKEAQDFKSKIWEKVLPYLEGFNQDETEPFKRHLTSKFTEDVINLETAMKIARNRDLLAKQRRQNHRESKKELALDIQSPTVRNLISEGVRREIRSAGLEDLRITADTTTRRVSPPPTGSPPLRAHSRHFPSSAGIRSTDTSGVRTASKKKRKRNRKNRGGNNSTARKPTNRDPQRAPNGDHGGNGPQHRKRHRGKK